MQEIELTAEESTLLERFTNAPESPVIKKILLFYKEELQNIKSIDPKGNVGLQTVASLRALETIESVIGKIFPELAPAPSKVTAPKISPWR